MSAMSSGGVTHAAANEAVTALFASSHEDPGDERRERRVIARAAEGDREALQQLYKHYAWTVYRHVRRYVWDEHEAQDVTQAVFLKLISDIGRYEERRGRFSSWLLCMARNVAIDHMRRARPVLSGDTEPAGPADDTDSKRRGALLEALGALSHDQREVLVLRQLLGLTPAEIALRMDRTEGSVHALHHRARVATCSDLVRLNAAPAIHRAGYRRRGIAEGRDASRRPVAAA
jgi:RNA polymerase sigma-70 factor (ECF subfamily)